MKNKGKVIVTGGMGYIGSHTAVELLLSGFEVVLIDNLSNSKLEVLDGIERITKKRPLFVHQDIQSPNLNEIFSVHADALGVIHFAALKAVEESVENPLLYYDVNVSGLVNLLIAMRENAIKNFIFSSSATVYGQPKELPATEESPIADPVSPYGNTKQIGEEIIRDTTKMENFGLKAISLRYFNPIGAHPSAQIGEWPTKFPRNLLPYLTQSVIGKRGPLKIFGNDYNTKDGTAIRDYIHVVDIAKAHVLAFNRLILKLGVDPWEVFNLGSGKGNTVFEVINSFERSTGMNVDYEIVDRRAGDAEAIFASIQKASEVLGWKPEYHLDDMTRSAWEWEINH